MIHQLIFAHPRPGMTEEVFQNYWVNFHAVYYASNITQIKRYMVDTRIPFGPEPEDPLFSGVAEIWLRNEEEQLASLQSREFVGGARLDEPNWAAFWRTVGLDTTTHVLMEGPPLARDSNLVKLLILTKRKAGMPLEEFRQQMLNGHGTNVQTIPGLERYWQCHVRDGFYAVGEAILDAVSLLWFENVEAMEKAVESAAYQQEFAPESTTLFEPKYIHTMATQENWIIGPEFRD
ncbi:MAG: EthD domain-containing protein [Crocosphaera sp.]